MKPSKRLTVVLTDLGRKNDASRPLHGTALRTSKQPCTAWLARATNAYRTQNQRGPGRDSQCGGTKQHRALGDYSTAAAAAV